MRHAFITAGSGFIGKALIRELLDNNWKVTALYRANSPRKMLSDPNLILVEGDLTEKESLIKGMKDCDTVFHCAALYREAKFPDEMYWKVNFDDHYQTKWRIWWNIDKDGLGFSFTAFAPSRTSTAVGSRLLLRSEELAKYCAKQFKDLWSDYILM